MANRMCNEITIKIKAMLATTTKAEAPVRTECSIRRTESSICMVPRQIRDLNKDAYTPKFVSIGPFHHRGSDEIHNMEIHKRIYFKEFLERSKTDLENLVSLVEGLEPQVRDYYSEYFDYCSKEYFVTMILVDAGFILELLFKLRYGNWTKDDALLEKWGLIDEIIEDLHLLENQLPFIVFEELSKLAFHTSLIDNLLIFSNILLEVWYGPPLMGVAENIRPTLHFTELLRESCLQRSDFRLPERLPMITVRSATELHELGVKFKPGRRSKSLLDLQFSDGILRIPQLLVNARTEKLFRNMIALERCHYPHEPYITDYVFLLSCLIKTDEDADFLIKNRIIVNHLDRSNNMRGFFSSLGSNTAEVSLSSVHSQLCKELNVFCLCSKRTWRIALRRDYYLDFKRTYCKSPLQTLATLGGILLIILTVIQTVCSILQVK